MGAYDLLGDHVGSCRHLNELATPRTVTIDLM
jgi:hypothetical protein